MILRLAWSLALLLGFVACSPSLNWRTVPVEQIAALLPCKPDHAERLVDLGGAQRTLSMWGCEADGALFAVSHLRMEAPTQSGQVIAAWQQAAMRNMPGATAQALPFKALRWKGPVQATQTQESSAMVRASGKSADGKAVQAQLAWFSRGVDMYHLAVYAPELTAPMTDTFFTEWHWQ